MKYQPPKSIRTEHQEFMKKIGLKLQEQRKNRGISISSLSTEIGISRNAYAQMEAGKVYFNFLSLLQVLDYFQISKEDFFAELKKDT